MKWSYVLALILILVLPPVLQADEADQNNLNKIARTRAMLANGLESSVALPAQTGPKSERASLGSTVLRMIQGLGLCTGLFFVGVFLYRRYGPPQTVTPTRRMRVVDRIQLASKTTLLLIEAEGRRFLVTVGSERVTFMDGALDPVLEREPLAELSVENNELMDLSCLKPHRAA